MIYCKYFMMVVCLNYTLRISQTCNVNCFFSHQTYYCCAPCQTLSLLVTIFLPLKLILLCYFLLQLLFNLKNLFRSFIFHHQGIEIRKNLSQSSFVLLIFKKWISYQEVFEVSLCEDGDLTSSVSVKYCKKICSFIINVKFWDMSILHGFSPASHVSYIDDKVFRL